MTPDAVSRTRPNAPNFENFWMPFTANRQFKESPRLLVSGEEMNYTSIDGKTILDGTAGLWCVNAGHGRPQIVEAVERQLRTLDFAPTFQMGHPIAFDFAERLAAIAPSGLDRIFFTGSGSESVETALKISLAYQRAIGQGTRTRFIGRERGYHGVQSQRTLRARKRFLDRHDIRKSPRKVFHLLAIQTGAGYQRKSQRPATAPTLTTMSVAGGYQVATKSGESSVQLEA